MARALLVVRRCGGPVPAFESSVRSLNRHLTPDNIEPWPVQLAYVSGIASAIFNPSSATRMHGISIRLGATIGQTSVWYLPGTPPPEGSYAIMRADARRVELLADAVGSRTLWYALTPNELIASTSQRAIVVLLGSFDFNPSVVPWMLSTGTLGPSAGWDRRVQRVLPGQCVSLDRTNWRVETSDAPASYVADRGVSRHQHAQRLAEAVDGVSRSLEFESEKWLLPLTGGVDSRGLLASLLRGGRTIRTITWGQSRARRRWSDDAKVSRKIAEKFGVPNRFFPVNLSTEPRERLIHRFLVAGEGRVELIPPFVDGFAAWKSLSEDGIDGILRGDQAFGGRFVHTPFEVRNCTKLSLLSDFFQPAELATFELEEQQLPERLARRSGETLAAWRDRLYEQNRLSSLLAGLTDLQTAYVEVVNPLLFSRVLACPRRLPDDLRNGKILWRQVVRSRSSKIPFARRPAVLPLQDFLNDTAMLELMLAEFESNAVVGGISRGLCNKVRVDLRSLLQIDSTRRPRQTARTVLTHCVPPKIRAAVRRYFPEPPMLRPGIFAFRAFIVSRMSRLLEADARELAGDGRHAASL